MGRVYNFTIEVGMLLCFMASLYMTFQVAKISWHRETMREQFVHELHCREYGRWINNWAEQRNQEPPCK